MSTQRDNSQCVNSHTVFQMTLYREPLGENKDCVLLANKHRSWKHAYEFPWRNPEAAWESIEAEQLQP